MHSNLMLASRVQLTAHKRVVVDARQYLHAGTRRQSFSRRRGPHFYAKWAGIGAQWLIDQAAQGRAPGDREVHLITSLGYRITASCGARFGLGALLQLTFEQ